MPIPADMPPAERWPHGVRARYVRGCRCDPCREANKLYARKRNRELVYGRTNGLVDAAKARAHIRRLSSLGVGRLSVAIASDVPRSTVCEIAAGRRKQIRERTEKRLLAVDVGARADHALVSAKRTWERIRSLMDEGYTKRALARELGYSNAALQFRQTKVLVATAAKVERLYRRLTS